jgi:membrane-associated protease RseP (regulator of RpoE activity)
MFGYRRSSIVIHLVKEFWSMSKRIIWIGLGVVALFLTLGIGAAGGAALAYAAFNGVSPASAAGGIQATTGITNTAPCAPMIFSDTVKSNVIVEVVAGGPAEKAGLKVGDVVLAVDGKDLGIGSDLATAISTHKPGDTVTLKVQTGTDAARDVKVTLGQNPNDSTKPYLGVKYAKGGHGGGPHGHGNDDQGFGGGPFGGGGHRGFGGGGVFTGTMSINVTVIDVQADSPAAKAGVQANDVIKAIDGTSVTDPVSFMQILMTHKAGDTIKLTVVRGSETKDLSVTLGAHPQDSTKPYLGVRIGGGGFQHPSFPNLNPQTPTNPTLFGDGA